VNIIYVLLATAAGLGLATPFIALAVYTYRDIKESDARVAAARRRYYGRSK
jgi:biopolymer transport protein ExbB/TolQ